MLDQQLHEAQLDLLRRASAASHEHGVELLLVGGTVRDILRGGRPADLDLVTAGGAPGFGETLAQRLGGEVVAHSQFETNKLAVGGVAIDLAAARKESYSRPGALPDVVPGSIDDDLARRDFSVNAMAVSLLDDRWGDLLDPFDGQADIRRGLVRVLHAESFVDDPTRVLRAVRHTHRMGFRLEEETRRLLRRGLQHLGAVGGDRIRHELVRIFREEQVAEILAAAQELGILSAIHPALRVDQAVLAKLPPLPGGPSPDADLRRLAMLVFSVPAQDMPAVIGRLNMDGRWATVARDVAAVRASFERLKPEGVRPSEVHRMLHSLHVAAVEACALATGDPAVRERLDLYLRELRHVRPLLDGNDLIALGVPAGPEVGRLLEELLTARLDGLLSVREDEERLVLRSPRPGDA